MCITGIIYICFLSHKIKLKTIHVFTDILFCRACVSGLSVCLSVFFVERSN